jgi:hypothetical protein
MTNSLEDLQTQIERLVREHLAAQRQAAAAAVERAFASVAAPTRARVVRKQTGRRRASTEVSGLAQRLYEAVRAHPGETITVIAAEVGESPRALHLPMAHLKREGRVRSAGQRHLTRYFPMSSAHKSA